MAKYQKVEVGCRLVGDFADEAEIPSDLAVHGGEAVRPNVVAEYIELGGEGEGLKEFTVLLRDGRVVAVHGHGLKHAPNSMAGQDVFAVVQRTAGEEVFVALFKSADVAGIFHGEIRPDRKIA